METVPPALENDLADLLATVVSGIQDTIRDRPSATIVPRAKRETASERALGLLRELAGVADGSDGPLPELVLGGQIARGGMGEIHLAEQVSLGREVAVKTLRRDLDGDVAATLELLREAWVTGTLEHPNVMPVYNIALDDAGNPLIVLKRIEGVNWSELMTDKDTVSERYGAVDLLEWNLEILLRVLDALRFAHSRSIIHRDVKPENVMIGEFGEVYLVDWGIAVSLTEDPSGRLPHVASTFGSVAGTPCYLAPEMLGEEQDARTDVYLAGAVLYEIIVGRPPHLGKSVLEVLTNVATSEPALSADAPPELAEICAKAIARDPVARFASVDEMRSAVVRFLGHRGSSKLSDQAAERLVALQKMLSQREFDVAKQREDIYRLLGEVRFGFGAALSAWEENPQARSGIREALASVAQFELDNDDPGAADSLLSELASPPDQLRSDVDNALSEREEARRHYAALADDADISVGNRTRMFLTVILGTVWTVTPLLAYFLDRATQMASKPGAYQRTAILTLGILLFIAGLAGWARESITRSRVNRLLAATMLAALACQLSLIAGSWLLELDPVTSQVFFPLLWALGAMIVAVLEIRGALPLALGYLGAFLLSAAYPKHRFLFMAGANLVVTVNALLIWNHFAGSSPDPQNDGPD